MARRTERLNEAVHHMVMACISGDTDYLLAEIHSLRAWFDVGSANKQELTSIMEVSLQASMDGRIGCLRLLHEHAIPMDELCPIIAAYHGKREVITFCEGIALGDCEEAWNRLFDWMLCQGSQMDDEDEEEVDITLANEWVSNYTLNNANRVISCSAN